jgi:hypothetical protein
MKTGAKHSRKETLPEYKRQDAHMAKTKKGGRRKRKSYETTLGEDRE